MTEACSRGLGSQAQQHRRREEKPAPACRGRPKKSVARKPKSSGAAASCAGHSVIGRTGQHAQGRLARHACRDGNGGLPGSRFRAHRRFLKCAAQRNHPRHCPRDGGHRGRVGRERYGHVGRRRRGRQPQRSQRGPEQERRLGCRTVVAGVAGGDPVRQGRQRPERDQRRRPCRSHLEAPLCRREAQLHRLVVAPGREQRGQSRKVLPAGRRAAVDAEEPGNARPHAGVTRLRYRPPTSTTMWVSCAPTWPPSASMRGAIHRRRTRGGGAVSGRSRVSPARPGHGGGRWEGGIPP